MIGKHKGRLLSRGTLLCVFERSLTDARSMHWGLNMRWQQGSLVVTLFRHICGWDLSGCNGTWWKWGLIQLIYVHKVAQEQRDSIKIS